ncbi:MAG: ubiquinol-cytochrome c reductase iron-sulfur subunit [Burkholderiales bacterium]
MDKTANDPTLAEPGNPDTASDPARRKILVAATGVAGGAALAAVSVPFIASMMPSERARAAGAPVSADAMGLEPGAQLTVEWRSKPVWILRRTEAMLKVLEDPRHLAKLADPGSDVKNQQPTYARNAYRSVNPEYLVVVGICTHLGCVPTFRPDIAPADIGPDWDGGYFCPCHGSKFDLAGRVWRNVPAPTNLVIPAHHFLSGTKVVIGRDTESTAS